MSKISILTGPIRSGKTTYLSQLIENKTNVYGVLCPDVDDRRHVKFLPSKETYKLEVDETFENKITIGKFHFDAELLTKVSDYLAEIDPTRSSLIVVDEVGKLEMKDQGFEPGLSHLIKKIKETNSDSQLILVVRDYLVDEVVEKYGLMGIVEVLMF